MAERLTMTSGKGGVAFTFDLDITCRPLEAQKILKLAEKLKHYEDLEERCLESVGLDFENMVGEFMHYYGLQRQGRLIELPCKIGDTVYGSFQCYDGNKINECKVTGIRACKLKANSECYYIVDVEFNIIDPFYNDGRLMFFKRQAVIGNNYGNWERVFFTKEEAEAALKEVDK